LDPGTIRQEEELSNLRFDASLESDFGIWSFPPFFSVQTVIERANVTSMYPSVTTKDPTAVGAQAQAAYLAMFPDGDLLFVPRVFSWAVQCFTGNYRDFQAVDARYHDFEHTLQGTLCLARLLLGRHRADAQPPLTQRVFELVLLAILLHDTGYLKKRDDLEGTGAKYTVTHVERSADFAAALLSEKSFNQTDIQAVQSMIRCTGVNARLGSIPFGQEIEQIAGFALATADLLGQMAALDYVEKLPLLYSEFAEAAAFSPGENQIVGSFSSANDLIRKTPAFWENLLKTRLDRDFGGVYRFLNEPYPSGPNDYLQRIEAEMRQLKQSIEMQPQPG
jgi:hypothetical protein